LNYAALDFRREMSGGSVGMGGGWVALLAKYVSELSRQEKSLTPSDDDDDDTT